MKDLEVFRNVLRYRWMDKRCADLVELDALLLFSHWTVEYDQVDNDAYDRMCELCNGKVPAGEEMFRVVRTDI